MIKPPPKNPSADELADWVELEVMFGDRGALSSGEAMRLFADLYGDDEPDEAALEDTLLAEESGAEFDDIVFVDEMREAAAEGLSAAESRWDSLIVTLNFRRQVVGAAYPIAVDADALVCERAWSDEPLYAFLSLVAARITYKLSEALAVHKPAKLFEQIVAIALGEYMGGRGYRFGWPRLEDEPVEDFPKKVRNLTRQMGEHIAAMRNVGPDDKDHQLDVIAWRSFHDSVPEHPTPGQAVIVCQCGIGEDWNAKVLAARIWEAIIDFAVPPLAALAFPVVPSREDDVLHIWHDIASAGSIPFDRLRIASLVDPVQIGDQVTGELVAWIADSWEKLPQV